MKKKLIVMLFAAVIIFGFAKQEPTQAENQPPRITSIQPGTFVALN
jgi:hypothetical protein